MTVGDFWIFLSALCVAFLVPGADMVLLLQTGAQQGRRSALTTAAGLALARATHVALAGLGLAALLKASPGAFEAVRLFGAAYLIWLGIKIFRAPSLTPDATEEGILGGGHQLAAFRRGVLTNLLNPKALLFCSVLLPQFVRPDAGSAGWQFFVLGSVLVITGLAFDAAYACAGGSLSRLLSRSSLARIAQRWVFATLLIGFGTRLALA
jgi:threonine/homoserine/homoserine lactone efflux protein